MRQSTDHTVRPIQVNVIAIFVLVIATWLWGGVRARAAESAYDTVIRLTATTSATSTTTASIVLNWTASSDVYGSFTIYRRLRGESSWTLLGTATAAASSSYTDTVSLGNAYEYSFTGTSTTAGTVRGEIVAGHNIPLVESRGKVILLVDNTMATPLDPELKQLTRNLVADGWTVLRNDVARQSVPATSTHSTEYAARLSELQSVQALVKNTYTSNGGGNDWALFIFGHIPVPYSGELAPDGHGNHVGAWPTDLYYGDVDGAWTDTTVNTADNYTQPSDARNINVPGDGKFDAYSAPTNVELQTGRVDLWNMGSVPVGASETELLRQYLVRNNRFRRNAAPYNTVARRGLIDDNFGYFSGEAFAASGWRTGVSWFGTGSGKMDSLDWFSTLETTPMLFAYGCGGGTLTGCEGVGYAVQDFGLKPSKAVFTLLFGSWFGDFDSADNFLRSPLAGPSDSLGLASAWSGRGYFHLEHMALGDTIGYSARYTQNIPGVTGDWDRNASSRPIQANLMGDPTLRLHSLAPPASVTATSSAGVITINWQASPDTTLSGYHLYRATSANGPFTRISGSTASGNNPTGSCLSPSTFTYVDTDSSLVAATSYTYLVKAVRMEVSACGTYANQSLGEYVTLTHSGSYLPVPARFSVQRTGSNSCLISWDDIATTETAYLLERRDNSANTWGQIASLAANSSTYTDTGLTLGRTYHYRLRATDGTLYSEYTTEASDYNKPGYLRDTNYSYTTTKGAGVINVVANRFNGSGGSVSVGYTTSEIIGTPGTDITITNSTVTWNNNEATTKSAPIAILAPTATQSTRIFKVSYTNPTNGLTLSTPSASYVLVRDQAATLPAGWSTTTLGTILESGYSEHSDGNFGLVTRSDGIICNVNDTTGDSMRFLYQSVSGDFQLTARLNYLSAIGSNVRAGLMVRESLSVQAPMTGLMLSPSLICARYSRTSSKSAAVLYSPYTYAPQYTHWLRITRTGSTYTTEQSANGTSWAAAAPSVSIGAIPTTAYVGLAMSTDPATGNVGPLGYARLDNVSIYTPPSAITTLSTSNGASSGQIALAWTASAAATAYKIERTTTSGGNYSTIATVNAPTLTYTDANLTAATTYYYRVTALNPAYNATASAEASSQPYIPATMAGWSYTYFGTESATGNAAPSADPDHDGLPNIVEYAHGLHPTVASASESSSLPTSRAQLINGESRLTLTFVRNKKAADIAFVIEVTDDLTGSWTTLDALSPTNQLSVLDDTPSSGLQTITVKDTQAVGASVKRFMRLRISSP